MTARQAPQSIRPSTHATFHPMSCTKKTALIFCLSALLAGCAAGKDPDWLKISGGPPLKIAVVGPMSGNLVELASQLRTGVSQAEAMLNQDDGVLTHVLTIRAVDDHCNVQQAEAIARGLAAEKITVVVGNACPDAALAAAPIYSENNMLMLAPTTTSVALTEDAANRGATTIIRIAPSDDLQGVALAKHILAAYPGAAVAIVQNGTRYGKSIADSTRTALAAAGVHPVIDETAPPGGSAYESLTARLKAANVGVVVFGGSYGDAAELLLAMRAQGLKSAFGGGNSLFAPDFLKRVGAQGEGVFMSWLPNPVSIIRGTYRAAGQYTYSDMGIGIKGFTLYAYAAIQVFAQAAKRANSIDPVAVAQAIRNGTYETIIGPLRFDQKGDVQGLGFVVYAWHDGSLVTFD